MDLPRGRPLPDPSQRTCLFQVADAMVEAGVHHLFRVPGAWCALGEGGLSLALLLPGEPRPPRDTMGPFLRRAPHRKIRYILLGADAPPSSSRAATTWSRSYYADTPIRFSSGAIARLPLPSPSASSRCAQPRASSSRSSLSPDSTSHLLRRTRRRPNAGAPRAPPEGSFDDPGPDLRQDVLPPGC